MFSGIKFSLINKFMLGYSIFIDGLDLLRSAFEQCFLLIT